MGSGPIHYVVELAVKDGGSDAVQSLLDTMARDVQALEPDTLQYRFYVSEDGSTCYAHEWFTDSDALIAHFKGAPVTELLPKVLEHVEIRSLKVFGEPSPEAAELLGGFGGVVHRPLAGFSR